MKTAEEKSAYDKLRAKRWRESNPEAYLAKAKRYRDANPEKCKAATLRWRERNPEKWLEIRRAQYPKQAHRGRRRLYGVTEEQYNSMFKAQGGVCALCGHPPSAKSLCVDHDHTDGRIRGLLCNRCNLAVSDFTAEFCRKMLAYLEGEKPEAETEFISRFAKGVYGTKKGRERRA